MKQELGEQESKQEVTFNSFMPNELFYNHSLDRSISYIRGVWLVFYYHHVL